MEKRTPHYRLDAIQEVVACNGIKKEKGDRTIFEVTRYAQTGGHRPARKTDRAKRVYEIENITSR